MYKCILINTDEYTMISTYDYFGNLKICYVISSSSLLHDNIFVATLLEPRKINRHKNGFKLTLQTKQTPSGFFVIKGELI